MEEQASLSVRIIVIKRVPRDKKILLLVYNLTMWGSYTSHFIEIQQTWFVYPYGNLAPRAPFRALPIMLGTENLLWLHNFAMFFFCVSGTCLEWHFLERQNKYMHLFWDIESNLLPFDDHQFPDGFRLYQVNINTHIQWNLFTTTMFIPNKEWR